MKNENKNNCHVSILDGATETVCKVIIAELENVREEMKIKIDEIIDNEIKNFSG